jgi:hypothetical protein
MKRVLSLFSFSLLLGSAASAAALGCSTTTAEEGVAQDEINGSDLDDAVAKTLLAGGCEVEVDGRSSSTVGSGGACPTTLSGILDVMDKQQSKTFVVSEEGDQPKAAGHRFVIAATGANAGKLFVATVSSGGDPDEDGVEAMGFSPSLNAFAYYKVERGQWIRKGDATQVKAQAKDAKPAFECIGCHTTGAPLMKELHDSWSNWHSTWFSGMQAPSSASPLFKRMFDKKQIADSLEPLIIDGIKLHSKGRVSRAAKEGELKGILTQLMCEVGEPTLIAAHSKNSERVGKVSSFSSMLPTGILLNPLFTPPRTGTGSELGLSEALKFQVPSLGTLGQGIDATAYASTITKNSQTIGGKPGDAMFPMSSPEKSFADLDAVQELLRQGLVDADIVGDVLMTDFTVSAFSDIRCALAETLPDTWKDADDLRSKWTKSLGSSRLRGAKGLQARLEDEKDAAKHAAALETFASACASRDKAAFTEDMLKVISQRRVEFRAQYERVVESDWLIPADGLRSRASAIRLGPTTCEIEATTEKAGGED